MWTRGFKQIVLTDEMKEITETDHIPGHGKEMRYFEV